MGGSLYAQYIKEREGKRIIESDNGFATYQIHGDECYIEDIYVVPRHRRGKVASQLADSVVEDAKKQGCKILTGSVVPSTRGSTTSLKVLLGYGFSLWKCEHDFILFRKEI